MSGQFSGTNKRQKNGKMALIMGMMALIGIIFIFYCGVIYVYLYSGRSGAVGYADDDGCRQRVYINYDAF